MNETIKNRVQGFRYILYLHTSQANISVIKTASNIPSHITSLVMSAKSLFHISIPDVSERTLISKQENSTPRRNFATLRIILSLDCAHVTHYATFYSGLVPPQCTQHYIINSHTVTSYNILKT